MQDTDDLREQLVALAHETFVEAHALPEAADIAVVAFTASLTRTLDQLPPGLREPALDRNGEGFLGCAYYPSPLALPPPCYHARAVPR